MYPTVFLHAIQQLQVILHTELILLQEFSKKYYNYKAHPVQAPSSNCSPCLQAFYTAEYSTPSAPYTSRLPVILPGRNSILHGSQHPRSPYSNSQASSTSSTLQNSTRRNRIHSKGLSIVCPCNTKVSVFQFYKKINSIQSSSNSMRRYSTLSSIQVILVAIPHKLHSNGYEYTRIRS